VNDARALALGERRRDHFAEEQAVEAVVDRLPHREAREQARGLVDRISPCQGRAECARLPRNVTSACAVPRQPSWIWPSVGSMQIASSVRSNHGCAAATIAGISLSA